MVAISHSVTPYDQTSEAWVNSLFTIDSMAIHFQGSLPFVVFTYISSPATTRDMPKSEIFKLLFSPIRIFRHARSRCTISKLDRYSYSSIEVVIVAQCSAMPDLGRSLWNCMQALQFHVKDQKVWFQGKVWIGRVGLAPSEVRAMATRV